MKTSPNLYVVLACACVAAVLYYPSLHFPFLTNYDDGPLILENFALTSISWENLKTLFTQNVFGLYHPITSLSFLLDWTFWGKSPFAFRAVNLAFHIANSFLVFLLLQHFSKKPYLNAMLAAVFAVHSVHVESVAWISERKDLVYGFFSLLSLLFYLHGRKGKPLNLYLSMGFFLFACLGKLTAVSLVLAFPLIEWFYRERPTKARLLFMAISTVIAILVAYVNLQFQDAQGLLDSRAAAYTAMERFIVVMKATGYYLLACLFPLDLSPKHFYPAGNEIWAKHNWYFLGFLLLPLTYALVKEKRNWLFSWAVFFLLLLPSLKLIPTGNDFMNERYLYLPLAGFLLLISYFRIDRRAQYAFAGLWAIALFIQSWTYRETWQSEESIWLHVLQDNPEEAVAYNELGRYYLDHNDLPKATQYVSQAVTLSPALPHAHFNLGRLHQQADRDSLATVSYSVAISLDPDYAEAYNNRAISFQKLGKLALAASDSKQALKMNSQNPNYWNTYGIILAETGKMKEASDAFNKALTISPNHDGAKENLKQLEEQSQIIDLYVQATTLAREGRFLMAIEKYRDFLAEEPDHPNAWQNLGNCYLLTQDTAAACDCWEKGKSTGNEAVEQLLQSYCF